MKNLVTLRFMLISLFAAMSMMMNAEIRYYSTDEGFFYELDTETETAVLLQCRKSPIEVVIPASVTKGGVSFTVTSLGEQCFYDCSSLKSITIPSSVKSLGNGCFGGCSSLKSITIPSSSSLTSLGYWCFDGCSSLTSITIPFSVTSLGGYCFYACCSLTSITIPSSVTSLGEYCFNKCI